MWSGRQAYGVRRPELTLERAVPEELGEGGRQEEAGTAHHEGGVLAGIDIVLAPPTMGTGYLFGKKAIPS